MRALTDMRIGFTGTQRGMTAKQKTKVRDLFIMLDASEFHHGDCIGADADAHEIFRGCRKQKVILHPPTNQSKRAFCKADVTLMAYPYLFRNQEIVINSDVLIATPGEVEEQMRSGTWSTVRFARKQKRPIYIVFPDGRVQHEPDPMGDPAFR